MMRLVILFAVVVALRVYQISAFPRTFPRHEIAADGNDGIAARVVQAHILAQVARHLLSGFIQMRVQNLVANRPHQQRRMIAVAANPRGDIRRHVGGEEARVVKRRFGTQPHIKRFVYHENAELVAQVHHLFCGRIVACAQGIDPHLPHGAQLAAHRLFVERRPQTA